MITDEISAAKTGLKTFAGVQEIDPVRDRRWDEFVKTHPRASVFHSPNWLRALQAAYGCEPRALCTVLPGGSLTGGLVFCRISSWLTGRRLVSLPFSDHCEPLVGDSEALLAILQHLKMGMAEEELDYFEIRPTTSIRGLVPGLEECQTYFWHRLDLSGSSEALFHSFHKDSVQRRIRHAERQSLQYDVGNSEELLARFFRLLVMTRRRQYLPPQPFSWFLHLSRVFGDKLQVRLASHNGVPVASILTLKHGQTLSYKYGCSDARFKSLGATPLLLWRAIVECKGEGITQLDLGRSNVDNTGLVRFKEKWGAQRSELHYLRFSAKPSRGNDWTSSWWRTLAPVAPEWLLIAVGRLLYPHIG